MSERGEAIVEEAALLEGVPVGVEHAGSELIVVRAGGRVRAFDNRCPHRGITLDWAKGRFTSADGAYLQCATHGALFRMDDGACVLGPCAGESLAERPLLIANGSIFIEGEL
jgi:nitrite reductase/ring-hydroxylating ferredoxin subunit